MDSSDNPYEILGLAPDSDEDAIKKAYRQAARIHHPDKQKTGEERERATQKFAQIADAYNLLQDPVRRYDWRIANEGKLKSTPKTTTSPAKTTTYTTSFRPRPSVAQATQKRTKTPSTAAMPVPKRASVQPNSVRVSPPSTGRSSVRPTVVRTAAPPPNRRSTMRSPARPQKAQTVQGGRRANPNTNSMRNSRSVDSDLNAHPQRGQSGQGGQRANLGNTRRHMGISKSVDSDLNQLRRPVAGRKKNRETSVPRTAISRNGPRSTLDSRSAHTSRTVSPGRTSRINRGENWETMSCSTAPRQKKSPIRAGRLKRTSSLRSMASTRTTASSGRRSVKQ